MAQALVLAVYRNAGEDVSGEVFESNVCGGKFAVAVREDATGHFVGCTVHGFKTFEEAGAEARRMARLEAESRAALTATGEQT